MSDEDEDKLIENLENQMRGGKKRTVAQERIAQMMGDFQSRLAAERAEADRQRRVNEATRRREALARGVIDLQDEGDDELGEASTGGEVIPLRR